VPVGETGEEGPRAWPGGGFWWVIGERGGGVPSSMVAASEGLKPSADPLDGVWNAGTAGEEAEEPLSGTKVAASWSNFSSLKSLIALIAPFPGPLIHQFRLPGLAAKCPNSIPPNTDESIPAIFMQKYLKMLRKCQKRVQGEAVSP